MTTSSVKTVIIINDHAYINGGQAKVAIESAKALAQAGLKVIFYAACGPADGSLIKSGVQLACLNQKDILSESNRIIGALRGLWNKKAAKTLRKLLEEHDPKETIIHCHGFAKALSPSIGPVITKGGFPHIYTVHEYFLACPNGGFFDYKRNKICTRRALGSSCLLTNCDVRHFSHKYWRALRQVILWTFGRMPRNLEHIIYISDTQKQALRSYISANTQLHFVPNPVSIEKTPRVQVEKNEIFLFIGRLSPEKGALLFAKAAKEAKVKAVIVGDGVERKRISQVNPNALITGWLDPSEVANWLEKARCLVFSSLWYDCQPLVPLEAMARGVPVICGDWNAASESIHNSPAKLPLLENTEPKTLASAMIYYSNLNTLSETSKTLYEHYWESPLDLPNHIRSLTQLYKTILSTRTSSSPSGR